jgi:predicted DNA-binding mobile mystery protein A
MNDSRYILHQTDQEIQKLVSAKDLNHPSEGWVNAIRKSLGMSLRQLGQRMRITPQSVKEIEEREQKGTVSIKVMKQFATALGMKFVYGFIPREKSLEAMIDRRVREIADEILYKTSMHHRIGGKEDDPDRFLKAFIEKTRELKANMPVHLWDD